MLEKIFSMLEKIKQKRRAFHDKIGAVVILVIALFIVAILIPPALQQIYGANTSGWNSAVITVFQVLLPVLAIIGVALYFFKEVKV